MAKNDISEPIAIRMPKGLLQFIDGDIETTMLHSNRTDWIVSACMAYRHTRLEELRLTEGGGGIRKSKE